jgi:hypothetical protein
LQVSLLRVDCSGNYASEWGSYADIVSAAAAAAAAAAVLQVSLVRVDCSGNYASEQGSCLLGRWLGQVAIANSSFEANLVRATDACFLARHWYTQCSLG